MGIHRFSCNYFSCQDLKFLCHLLFSPGAFQRPRLQLGKDFIFMEAFQNVFPNLKHRSKLLTLMFILLGFKPLFVAL